VTTYEWKRQLIVFLFKISINKNILDTKNNLYTKDMICNPSKEYDFKLVSTADCHYPKQHLWKDRMLYKYLRPNTHSKNAFLAKNAEIKTVGVTYGFLGKDIALHEPDYLIDDISYGILWKQKNI